MTGSGTVHDPAEIRRLVDGAQHGDTVAISALIDVLVPLVGRWCGPIALQDGPDAAQEAMIAILGSIGQLRTPAALFGWARTIAVREAVRVAQRGRAHPAYELADPPERGDPQLAADVRDVLARLSPEHRAILMLRDLEGLDEQSAAELLRVPPGTAKSRLHRARRLFRKAWQQ